MKLKLLIVGSMLLIAFAFTTAYPKQPEQDRSKVYENRCGWFSNPTPANASLYDRYGEWTVAKQGGHQAIGEWPVFKPNKWVRTNRDYGYGCA